MNPSDPALAYGAHLARRRAECDALLSAHGLDHLLIPSGRHRLRFLDDQNFPFRANPHFLAWLPLPELSDSWLVLSPGRRPRLIYHQPVDFWHVPPSDPSGDWTEHFDIVIVRHPEEALRHLPPPGSRLAVIGEADWALGHVVPDNPPALIAALDFQRSIKSDYELACMREASLRAARGHRAAEAAFAAGASELAITLAFLAGSGQGEQDPPYHSIVALGEHAAVLHYQHRETRPPEVPKSLLIDAGASHAGYAADITRTYAAPGETFFAALIEAMEGIEQRLVGAVRPGLPFVELHQEAHREIAALLLECGLAREASAEALVDRGVSRAFFPHGLGHLLGLQVHDVAGHQRDAAGTPTERPREHPFLRLTRVLQPDMVLTIEPGLYLIPALLEPLRTQPEGRWIDWALVERLRPFGGIRIEDDVRVRAEGAENLTRDAFARLASAH
jgi:Xaa-Pro dipeptidase